MLETVSVVRVCKVYWKRKWKLKVESNLSWVPENSYKNITRHVGDQILKVFSPTDKNTSHFRVGEWLFTTLLVCISKVLQSANVHAFIKRPYLLCYGDW